MKHSKMSRGSLGDQIVDVYQVMDLSTVMTPESASLAFSALATLNPGIEYIRIEDLAHDVIAFADYELEDFLHANRVTDARQVLDPPASTSPAWRASMKTLCEMAGAESAAA